MKQTTLLLLLISLLSLHSFAQDGQEKKVTDAVESLRKAMVDPDKAVLDKLTAEDLSYGHSNGLIQTKQEFMEALTSGKSDFISIDLSAQTVKIVGNNAIVRHIFAGVTNDGGKQGSIRLSVLMVWQLQKGEWKLLARQATKVPLAN